MRRILMGVGLVVLALAVGGIVGHAVAATPTFSGSFNATPNDWYFSGVDTVSSSPSWCDTIIPDGIDNYAVVICTPSDDNVAGLYFNLSPSGHNKTGANNTGWALLRDEIGIWMWEGQVDTVFVRGAGAADTTGITRYQVWFLQDKQD